VTQREKEFYQRFDDLAQGGNPQRRGRALEPLVAELFERAGYKVKLDPRSAEPRQTDLVAVKGRDLYLVEVKWTSDPVDVDVIDALWARLDRTDSAARGVLVTVGGVTSGAVDLIERERDRPILVIAGEELGEFMYAPGRLPHSLRRKHRELFFNATVLLGEQALAWPEPSPGELEPSKLTFVKADGSRSSMIECRGGFGSCLFATTLADVDWVPTGGAAVAADVTLPLHSSGRIADLLKGFGALGWTSSSPHWVIQQADNCWFGFGAHEFVEAIDAYTDRYDGLERIHHTEQALYYDTFDGGLYTVAFDISVEESRRIDYCNLSLQMEGMPFDSEPLNQLLEFCEVERPVYGRSMTTAAVESVFIPRADQVDVTPLAFVVKPDRTFSDSERPENPVVCGVVVENPFWRGSSSDEKPEWWPDSADEPRYLVCSLRHHHPLSTPKHPYRLTRCQSTRTADICIVRPIVDW
jgi:hypothetical protein